MFIHFDQITFNLLYFLFYFDLLENHTYAESWKKTTKKIKILKGTYRKIRNKSESVNQLHKVVKRLIIIMWQDIGQSKTKAEKYEITGIFIVGREKANRHKSVSNFNKNGNPAAGIQIHNFKNT